MVRVLARVCNSNLSDKGQVFALYVLKRYKRRNVKPLRLQCGGGRRQIFHPSAMSRSDLLSASSKLLLLPFESANLSLAALSSYKTLQPAVQCSNKEAGLSSDIKDRS